MRSADVGAAAAPGTGGAEARAGPSEMPRDRLPGEFGNRGPRRAASWRRRASRSSGSFTVVRFMYASIPSLSIEGTGLTEPAPAAPSPPADPAARAGSSMIQRAPASQKSPPGRSQTDPAHPAGGVEGDHPQRFPHPPAVDRAARQQQAPPPRPGAQAAPPLAEVRATSTGPEAHPGPANSTTAAWCCRAGTLLPSWPRQSAASGIPAGARPTTGVVPTPVAVSRPPRRALPASPPSP